MTRTKPDEPEQTDDSTPDTPVQEAAALEEDASHLYEPYPGPEFFHGGRHSQIIAEMSSRLDAEGCTTPGRPLGPDWTNAHRDAFAAWQKQLRPKGSGDTSGIPDQVAWDKLQVGRISPLPSEQA